MRSFETLTRRLWALWRSPSLTNVVLKEFRGDTCQQASVHVPRHPGILETRISSTAPLRATQSTQRLP